jgi:hypothetical protein
MALAACDRPRDNSVPSVAPEAIKGASNATTPPPLPLNTDVNAAAIESESKSIAKDIPPQPDKDGANQALNVAAQDAAAKASDTALGDAATKQVTESGARGEGASNKAPGDELTKSEEASAMPKPGQANDHSTLPPEK